MCDSDSLSARRANAQRAALQAILAQPSFFETLLEAVVTKDGAAHIPLKDFHALLLKFYNELPAGLISESSKGIVRNIRRYIDPSLFSNSRHRFTEGVAWNPSRVPGQQDHSLRLEGLPDPPSAQSLQTKIYALVSTCTPAVTSCIACRFSNPSPFTAGHPDRR
jgi:hypothetical protein